MIKKLILVMLLSLGMFNASFAFTYESYEFNFQDCLSGVVSVFDEIFVKTYTVEDDQLLVHSEPCVEDVIVIENENLLKNDLDVTGSYTTCEKLPGTEEIVCHEKRFVEYKKPAAEITVYSFKSKLREPSDCCNK